MFTGQIAAISNKGTWLSDTYEVYDPEDKTTTDLTNPALTVVIVVTIKDLNGCLLATSSEVTIPGPGFQWKFEVADLCSLCAGTYRLGAKVTINGFVNDVIDGTIAVIEGN